jgi:hypothetical protein
MAARRLTAKDPPKSEMQRLDRRTYALAAKVITPLVTISAADRLPDFLIL